MKFIRFDIYGAKTGLLATRLCREGTRHEMLEFIHAKAAVGAKELCASDNCYAPITTPSTPSSPSQNINPISAPDPSFPAFCKYAPTANGQRQTMGVHHLSASTQIVPLNATNQCQANHRVFFAVWGALRNQ